MKYLELTIKAESNFVECLLNELSLAGICDAAIDNPSEIAEMVAGLGDTEWYDAEQVQVSTSELASVTVYCTDDEEGNVRADSVRDIVAKLQGENCDITLTETVRDDSEWKDAWKEYYHTAQVSEKFVVKPTWEDAHVDDGLFVIEIDPGMAFGTGTHETTSLSLKLMEKHVKRGDRVLDVGTGSGILAIAAAKLGASDILGIDIDEDAVRVANENIANNIAPTSNDANVRAVVGRKPSRRSCYETYVQCGKAYGRRCNIYYVGNSRRKTKASRRMPYGEQLHNHRNPRRRRMVRNCRRWK